MNLRYSASSRCSFTAMASSALARSTAVLQAGVATGATVAVSGLRVADDTSATALVPAGRSLDPTTAPTKTPPINANATSRPVSGSDGRQRVGAGRGPVGSDLG